jgi:hypothetical protein
MVRNISVKAHTKKLTKIKKRSQTTTYLWSRQSCKTNSALSALYSLITLNLEFFVGKNFKSEKNKVIFANKIQPYLLLGLADSCKRWSEAVLVLKLASEQFDSWPVDLSALMFLFRPSNTTRMKRNRKDEKLV